MSSPSEFFCFILAETAKIPRKHLLTLEPGIYSSQTTQMEESDLHLVVRQPVHKSYGDENQRAWLWTLANLIREAHSRP